MKPVFVSYPRPLRDVVDRLVGDLRQSGYVAYFDKELTGGQIWWDELLDRVESADVFMPVICRAYLESTPCKLEAQHAAACGKLILPVMAEDVPAQLFPASIAAAQWVTYDPNRQGTVFDVIRALNTLPPPPTSPVQRPPRPPAPISYMTELQDEIHGSAAIGKDRQFVLIGELKSRLRTSDRDAALLLLRTMASRNDLVHQAFMDINEVLTFEGVSGDSATRGTAGPGSPGMTGPSYSTPRSSHGSSEPAIATRRRSAMGRARPATWAMLAVGFLLLVLSLVAMDWLGADGVGAKFTTISSNINSRNASAVPFVYFKGLGYVLNSLAVLLALFASATARRRIALTWWSVGSGIVALIACFVGTGLLSGDLTNQLNGATVTPEPGFWVCLVALLLLVAAILVPRRRD